MHFQNSKFIRFQLIFFFNVHPLYLSKLSFILGDTFLNDEVLSSSSPLRTVDKVSTPEPATLTGFSTPEPATVTGFSSEFAKFLKSSSEELPRTLSQDFPPKACSVRLQQLYVDVTGLDMEAKSVAAVPSIDLTGTREPGKRDNDTVGATHDGPQNKRPKSDDVIILDGDSPNKSSSEISVVKQTKEGGSVRVVRL